MADLGVRIEGLDELERLLGKNLRPFLQRGTMAVAKELEGLVGRYPAAGPWNMPQGPGSHWYKRGYGGRYMTVGGELRDYGTSEDLGKSWVVAKEGTTGARLTNSASYAEYIHSDSEHVAWAPEHGWLSDADAIKKLIDSGAISDIMLDVIYHGIGWARP